VKKLSVAVLCILVVGITVFLIWLHDLRAYRGLSELQQQIVDKELVISELQKNTGVLQEFLDSDDPVDTRFAAQGRSQNPEMSEEQFRRRLQVNGESVRSKVENHIKRLPAALAARRRELADLLSRLDGHGKPWLFYR
jgi:biopolymer transport protein ExbB/TolQ